MRDKLSIQCSTDSKEKNSILEEYRKHSINVSARVLTLIRNDVENLRKLSNTSHGDSSRTEKTEG